VYIPGDLREALGIGPNEVVEVNVEGERLILERKKSSVSAKGRDSSNSRDMSGMWT